jgi:uncharacterized protein YjbK
LELTDSERAAEFYKILKEAGISNEKTARALTRLFQHMIQDGTIALSKEELAIWKALNVLDREGYVLMDDYNDINEWVLLSEVYEGGLNRIIGDDGRILYTAPSGK